MEGKTCLENTSFIDLWDQWKSLKTFILTFRMTLFLKSWAASETCFYSHLCDHGGHENKWLKVLIRKLHDWCWLHVCVCGVLPRSTTPALNTLLLTKSIMRKHHDAIKVPFFRLYFDLGLFHLLNCTTNDVAFGAKRERQCGTHICLFIQKCD